jgi:signal transduction histidine kinase
MNRIKLVLDAVAAHASAKNGIGIFFEGRIRFVGGNACHACEAVRRLSGSALNRELVSRFASVADIEGRHELQLPFGISVTAFSLKPAIATSAMIFAVTSLAAADRHSLDLAILRAQPRKAKKLIATVIQNMTEYQRENPEDLDGTFHEMAVEIKSRHEDWKESAFTNTLASYKDFVSSFCHEALSPIQEIQTALELTLKDKAMAGLSQQRLASSHRSLEGLRVSLEGMRLLFRDDHQQPLANQFREINLKSTVDRWLESYKAQFDEKNILAIAEPNSRDWRLRCVPEYVEILVRNLISNGVKYSFDASCFEDGEAGKFLVRFDQRQRRLTFINFGVPISPSEISTGSLFDRETRGGGANDRGRVGKGVGLYLVKRVVDLHNAEITVRSQLMNPGGSQEFARNEFEIRFPK